MNIRTPYTYPQFPLRRFVHEMTDGPFGSALTSSHYSDEGARVVRLGNIGSARFKDADAAFIPMFYFRELRRHEVKPGDLLIAGLGDDRHPVGRACIAPDHLGPAIVKADCYRVRLDENRLTHRFAAWALGSSTVSDQVSASTRGSTRSRINLEVAREIRLPVPPLEEQRRIADFLDAETALVDALSTARDAQVRCLEELWVSRLAHRVETWIAAHDLVPLRRVVESVEQGWSPQCDDIIAAPSEWAVLKTSAVSSGVFKPLEHKRLPDDISPDLRYQIADGDIIMTRGSGSPEHVGIPTVAHPDGRRLLLSDLLYRIRMSQGWSSEFTSLILRSQPVRGFMALLFRGQSGQTIKLRADDIRSIDLPAVPIHLQAQYATDLLKERQALSSAVAALRKSSALLAERRQALITAAVTGQIDVSTASGRGIEE
ncbi:restriction endonuclease subunit S [Streptomyces sp. NPDC087658]|uniref:restriction endonuclease subunit S n=1 Tax=Streptomyces sp. NPDC087658 TaxID=3365800 RepID=UPI0037F8D7D5